MPALIDYDLSLYSGKADWETDPVLTLDPQGFDTVTRVLCFKGTPKELTALIDIGSQTCPDYADKPMLFMGPRVLENRFGFVSAEMTWKGMTAAPMALPAGAVAINTNSSLYIRSLNMSMGTSESHWPREVGGTQFYITNPKYTDDNGLIEMGFNAGGGLVIPGAVVPYRQRFILRNLSAVMSGIIAGPRAELQRPPLLKLALPAALTGGADEDWSAFPDPLLTYSEDNGKANGWVCRGYDPVDELPLGDKILARFTARYEHVKHRSAA